VAARVALLTWHSVSGEAATRASASKPEKAMKKKVVAAGLTMAAVLALWMSTPEPAFAQTAAQCDAYARDVARRSTQGRIVTGAARGAVGGALLGGVISGRPGRGAQVGATVGTVSGAVRRGQSYDVIYQDTFRRCMRGR